MSQSSPQTALRPVPLQYLVPCWTLRLQKSKGNSAESKRKKSSISKSSLITAASTHDQSLYPNMDLSHVSLTSTVVFIVFFNQSLPFNEVVIGLTKWSHIWQTWNKEIKKKNRVQFKLSEDDPLLVMPLMGLRDTEPLFFQRTVKEKEKERVRDVGLATAAELLTVKANLYTGLGCHYLRVAHCVIVWVSWHQIRLAWV